MSFPFQPKPGCDSVISPSRGGRRGNAFNSRASFRSRDSFLYQTLLGCEQIQRISTFSPGSCTWRKLLCSDSLCWGAWGCLCAACTGVLLLSSMVFGEGNREVLPRNGVDHTVFSSLALILLFSHLFRSSRIGSGGPFSSQRMTGGFPSL